MERGAVIARITLLLLLAAGWTDDIWARSLMESPAVPLSFDEDVATLAQGYRLEVVKDLEAVRRLQPLPACAVLTAQPLAWQPGQEVPLPAPKDTDSVLGLMSLQR